MRLTIGDVILYKDNTGWIGKIISIFTRSKYVHSACYIGDDLIIESQWEGVKIKPIYGNYDVFRHKEASKTQLRRAVTFMQNQLNAKYDFIGVFGVAINILLGRKKNCFDDKNKYWCSELVADGYINAKISNDFNTNTILVDPSDFADKTFFKQISL